MSKKIRAKVDFFDIFIFNSVKSDHKITFYLSNKTFSEIELLPLQRLSLYRKPRCEINFVSFANEIPRWTTIEYFTYKDTRVELKYFVTFTQLLDFTDYQSLFEKRERYEKNNVPYFCVSIPWVLSQIWIHIYSILRNR